MGIKRVTHNLLREPGPGLETRAMSRPQPAAGTRGVWAPSGLAHVYLELQKILSGHFRAARARSPPSSRAESPLPHVSAITGLLPVSLSGGAVAPHLPICTASTLLQGTPALCLDSCFGLPAIRLLSALAKSPQSISTQHPDTFPSLKSLPWCLAALRKKPVLSTQ